MRRFSVVTVSTLALLSLAVAQMPAMPVDLRPSASAGPIIWSVFFASVVMLMPFVARSQHIMREFAMLAGISTVATSMDLLFIAVFSFSQFTSLTLSLFLSLGVYAAIRQWLVNQMMGARTLTTERMFNHLYRIAREVEAKPERAGERMTELLRNVFEPLEATRTNGRETQSRVTGNGAVLLVPLPNLVDAPTVKGMVALRFAERGKRLFTPEDARLAFGGHARSGPVVRTVHELRHWHPWLGGTSRDEFLARVAQAHPAKTSSAAHTSCEVHS